ncbi:LptF/LptG family permease [Spirochaeta dissipatitropha]
MALPAFNKHRSYLTISWYISKEFTLTFIVCFLFFFAIFFVNQLLYLAEEILQKRAPLGEVLLLMVYAMPSFIALSIPFATLVGALLTVGKFSSDNEIVAFQASGIPLSKLFLPMMILGIVFSTGSFVMNDILLPIGTINYGRLYRSLILSNPELELQPYSIQSHRNRVMVTGSVQENIINNLLIIDNDSEGNRRIIMGKSAELIVEDDKLAELSFSISDFFSHSYSNRSPQSWDYVTGERMQYRIPLQDLTDMVIRPGAREKSSVDVWKDIQARRTDFETRSYNHTSSIETTMAEAATEYWNMVNNHNRTQSYSSSEIRKVKDLQADINQKISRPVRDTMLQIYEIEFHKKFSIPFASLAFVLFAFPVGVFSRRSGRTVNFGIGLIICVLYWFFLLGGQTLGTQNHAIPPFLTMWFPNILLIVIGSLLLLFRSRR